MWQNDAYPVEQGMGHLTYVPLSAKCMSCGEIWGDHTGTICPAETKTENTFAIRKCVREDCGGEIKTHSLKRWTGSCCKCLTVYAKEKWECSHCHGWQELTETTCANLFCDRHNTKPKTQKARGLKLLRKEVNGVLRNVRSIEFALLTKDDLNNARILDRLRGVFTRREFFARGCPMRPMHGFVDSKVVKNVEELKELFDVALKVDPDAEMVLCKFQDAAWGVVLTPTLMTVGPGHDGATSGRNAVEVPVVGSQTLHFEQTDLASVGITESPYGEFLITKGRKVLAVQLRDGPAIKQCGDYIPEEMTVAHVYHLEAQVDLLEWQEITNTLPKGTVIYNAIGAGLASHYGVHCILHGMPFVKSFRPHVGDVLKPTARKLELDNKQFLEGLKLGLWILQNGWDWHTLGLFSLAALHNMPAFGPDESKYVGFGIGVTLRLGLMALYGESRHPCGSDDPQRRSLQRNQVYEQVWDNLGQALKGLPTVKERWKGDWCNTYGGTKWLNCHESLEVVLKATLGLVRARTTAKEKVIKLVDAFNNMINTAHNNGPWFNKFFSPTWMDLAAKQPSVVALHAAGVFCEVAKMEPLKDVTLWQILRMNRGGATGPFRPWTEGVLSKDGCGDDGCHCACCNECACECDQCVEE